MHEMGIALRIVDIAKSAIPPDMQNARISAVNLRVGKLTAIVPESLRFCFQIAAQNTPLEGAAINIEELPIRVKCRQCGALTTIGQAKFRCGECKSGNLDILSGRELTVSSIELAEPDD